MYVHAKPWGWCLPTGFHLSLSSRGIPICSYMNFIVDVFSLLVCFSLYLRLLWPLLLPFHLCQLCVPVHHPSLKLSWWHPSLLAWYHQASMMWFCQQSWFQGSQWGILVASPLWLTNYNLSPRCLLRHMPTMPWILKRWIYSFQSWATYQFICHMLVFVMLFAFCSQVATLFTDGSLTIRVCITAPFRVYPWQACFLVMVCEIYQECTEWLLFSLFE